MTLLGLYRILEFKGKLSLSTITDKGPNLNHFIPEWEKFLKEKFLPHLNRVSEIPEAIRQPKVFPILKTGPTSGPHLVNSSGWSLIEAARV